MLRFYFTIYVLYLPCKKCKKMWEKLLENFIVKRVNFYFLFPQEWWWLKIFFLSSLIFFSLEVGPKLEIIFWYFLLLFVFFYILGVGGSRLHSAEGNLSLFLDFILSISLYLSRPVQNWFWFSHSLIALRMENDGTLISKVKW